MSFPFFLGALIPTFIISRVALAITKKWTSGGLLRVFVCHVFTLMVSTLLAGFGMSDGGPWAPSALNALAAYLPPTLVWYAHDVGRVRGERAAEAKGRAEEPDNSSPAG